MNCPNCGCDIEKGVNKCPNCGTIVFKRNKSNTSKTSSYSVRKKSKPNDKDIVDVQNTNGLADISDLEDIKDKEDISDKDGSELTVESERTQNGSCAIPNTKSNIPADMDLGKSTKYYCSLRKTPMRMTRWQKLIYKFSPARDASPDKFEDAAIRNLVVAHLIIFLSILITFFANFIFYRYDEKRFNWMLTAVALCLLIWSRLFLDNAVKNYSYDICTENRKCKVSKSITAVLIVIDLIMTIFFLLMSYVYFLSDLYYKILNITT